MSKSLSDWRFALAVGIPAVLALIGGAYVFALWAGKVLGGGLGAVVMGV